MKELEAGGSCEQPAAPADNICETAALEGNLWGTQGVPCT